MTSTMVYLITKETTASIFKSNFMEKSGGEVATLLPVSLCALATVSLCLPKFPLHFQHQNVKFICKIALLDTFIQKIQILHT